MYFDNNDPPPLLSPYSKKNSAKREKMNWHTEEEVAIEALYSFTPSYEFGEPDQLPMMEIGEYDWNRTARRVSGVNGRVDLVTDALRNYFNGTIEPLLSFCEEKEERKYTSPSPSSLDGYMTPARPVRSPRSVGLPLEPPQVSPKPPVIVKEKKRPKQEKRFRESVMVLNPPTSAVTPCNCRKSKCLKLYCSCLAGGYTCQESCRCKGCGNTATVLVVQKRIKCLKGGVPLTDKEEEEIPLHCNCRLSLCQKKYCVCFDSGVACNVLCGCRGCQN